MGIFDGCLLVSDIDGTLMQDGIIPEVNLEAIEYFKSEGGIFTIATGRGPLVAHEICKKCKVNAPVLLANGTVIYDNEKREILHGLYLSDNTLSLMQKCVDKFPDIGLQCTLSDCIITINRNDYTDLQNKIEGVKYIKKSLADLKGTPVLKGLFMIENTKRIDELKKFLNANIIPDCTFVVTSPYYYEVLVNGVNKATNLYKLADILKIPHKNVFAIGDYYNDLEMVEAASIGAFCENTPNDLKPHANYIAKNVINGAVADFIHYLSKVRKEEEDG